MKTFCAVLAMLLACCSAFTLSDWKNANLYLKSSTCTPSATVCCLLPGTQQNTGSILAFDSSSCTSSSCTTIIGFLEYVQTGLCKADYSASTTISSGQGVATFSGGSFDTATFAVTPTPGIFGGFATTGPTRPTTTFTATMTANGGCRPTVTLTGSTGNYVFEDVFCALTKTASSVAAVIIIVPIVLVILIVALVVYCCCFKKGAECEVPCIKKAGPAGQV